MSCTPTPALSDCAKTQPAQRAARRCLGSFLGLALAVGAGTASADVFGRAFRFAVAPLSRTADDVYEAVLSAGGYRLRLTHADRAAQPQRWDSAVEILDPDGRTICRTQEMLVSRLYADGDRGWVAVVHESGSNTYVSFVSVGCSMHPRAGKFSGAQVEIAGDQLAVTSGRGRTSARLFTIGPDLSLSPTH